MSESQRGYCLSFSPTISSLHPDSHNVSVTGGEHHAPGCGGAAKKLPVQSLERNTARSVGEADGEEKKERQKQIRRHGCVLEGGTVTKIESKKKAIEEEIQETYEVDFL